MMKVEHLDNSVEASAASLILGNIAQHKEPDRQKWVTMVATVAISVLHGTYGKEFTEGYLQGALRSLTDPREGAPIEVIEVPQVKQ